ncbi:hypothetical protein UZ36_03155 [Candidatus Nitromaritima sp. SCGC AAA799-C22]|nr:hypothetical protein UZ36_03155 [Candidatus Nitromaritima sp. SCGC AAA799-C22]
MQNYSNVRLAAFRFLEETTTLYGEVLPRKILQEGFVFQETRIPLISPQGIFKPKILKFPLTITTAPPNERKSIPYDDCFVNEYLKYRYRGTDPTHPDNVGLRSAMEKQIPLIYFFGLIPGKYLPIWPIYIVGDDVKRLTFKVLLDDFKSLEQKESLVAEDDAGSRRKYITSSVKKRLHQHSFRERVLRAYHEQCSICRLHHSELLEAAHILPDTHPLGEPVVPNGLALCKLHHAAFDRNILGINPDFKIEIRRDILEEKDGPMLIHGLQGFQGAKIVIPRSSKLKPNPAFLEERFKIFQEAV